MANVVLTLEKQVINAICNDYKAYATPSKAAGVIFYAKLPHTTVTVYRSNKVMFQGAGAEQEAAKYGTTTQTATQKKSGDLPAHFEKLSVIGSDETGTGDYFGPITVAAVYIRAHQIALAKELGVKDSKQLNDAFILEIAPQLIAAFPHSILICRNEKYNELQAKGYSQGKMKAILHNEALRNVLEKIEGEPDYILIDQFAERPTYYNYLKGRKNIIEQNVLFATKAENLHVAVAAASIIARYAFLKEMEKLSKLAGIPLQKGASHLVDQMAASILQKRGETFLQSISKWHFANTEKAKRLLQKKLK